MSEYVAVLNGHSQTVFSVNAKTIVLTKSTSEVKIIAKNFNEIVVNSMFSVGDGIETDGFNTVEVINNNDIELVATLDMSRDLIQLNNFIKSDKVIRDVVFKTIRINAKVKIVSPNAERIGLTIKCLGSSVKIGRENLDDPNSVAYFELNKNEKQDFTDFAVFPIYAVGANSQISIIESFSSNQNLIKHENKKLKFTKSGGYIIFTNGILLFNN